MCAPRSHAFHATQRFAERALVVKQKTHHDGRKHQCVTPHMESMLTEAQCYCAKLSMAIFLAKCCDNCQNNSLADCAKTNKQRSSDTADMQQSINVHYTTASKSFHRDSVAYASNNTHRRPSTTNDTRPHKNKHTQAKREWLVGRLVGKEQQLVEKPTCLCFFPEKVLNST